MGGPGPVLSCKIRQSGAVSIVTVLLLAMVVMLVLVMTLQMSNTGVTDTLNQNDSVAALFLAESGIETASWNFRNTGVCDAANISDGTSTLTGGYSFTIEDIGAGFTVDFNGLTLPADQCHIKVTGLVSGSNTRRVLEAIIESSSSLITGANPDFNDPAGSGPPAGWTFTQSGAFSGDPWDDSGGPDGSRAALVYKPNPGGGAANGGGSFALSSFAVTAPATLTMDFDYKVESGNAPNSMQLSFSLNDGTTIYTSAVFEDKNTGGVFKSGSVSISITGTGSRNITSLSFDLLAKAGQPNRIWLDNLVLSGGAGGGGPVTLKQWREIVL